MAWYVDDFSCFDLQSGRPHQLFKTVAVFLFLFFFPPLFSLNRKRDFNGIKREI
jgi:hypothetical protein